MNGFHKEDLLDMGDIFGCPLDYRMKKSQMLDSLSSYILSHAGTWVPTMLESDLFLLDSLVAAGPGKKVSRPLPDYPSVLEAFGILQYSDSPDRAVRESWIDPDLYDAVRPYVKDALREGDDSGKFEIEAVAMGWLNLYGIIPYDLFVSRMVDYFSDCFEGEDVMLMTDILARSPLLRLCRFDTQDGRDCLASPCLFNPDSLVKVREQFPEIKDYKEFTYDDAAEAGSNLPDFTFAVDSPEGTALSQFLLGIGYYEDELPVLFHDVFMVSQRLEGEGTLLSLLKGVLEDSVGFEDEALFNRAMSLLVDYANILPKWALCGYAANDTGLLKVVYDPALKEIPLTGQEVPEDDYPHWSMPAPSRSEGYLDIPSKDSLPESLRRLLPGGYPFGMAVPHVAKDDPCPCGSGLKYRLCHGKHLN